MANYWSRDVHFYFGGYNPGTAMTRFALGFNADALETTTFTDEAETVIAGLRRDTLEWTGLFDDQADSMHAAATTLVGGTANNHVSVLVGTATGNPAYSGTVLALGQNHPLEVGGLVREEVTFEMNGTWAKGAHYGIVGTYVGTGATAISGTIDNAALSTGSGTFFLHWISVSGGTGSITLQDSADAAAWADLVTLTATGKGSVATSVGSGAGGTIRRYTRVIEEAGTGTDAVITAVLVRN